jgi:hypothetical protein
MASCFGLPASASEHGPKLRMRMLASISTEPSLAALRADLKVAPTLPVLGLLVLWTSLNFYYYQKILFLENVSFSIFRWEGKMASFLLDRKESVVL